MEPGTGFDLWTYQTYLESLLGGPLMDVSHRVPSWTGSVGVHQQAFLHCSRVLPPEYRTLKKATLTFWSSTVRIERRARSRCGVFVQWHQPEAEVLAIDAIDRAFVALPSWWRYWEVPEGFWCELGLLLAYVGSHLFCEPRSGWWVPILTYWVVEVFCYLV